jgi:hypothetical protein
LARGPTAPADDRLRLAPRRSGRTLRRHSDHRRHPGRRPGRVQPPEPDRSDAVGAPAAAGGADIGRSVILHDAARALLSATSTFGGNRKARARHAGAPPNCAIVFVALRSSRRERLQDERRRPASRESGRAGAAGSHQDRLRADLGGGERNGSRCGSRPARRSRLQWLCGTKRRRSRGGVALPSSEPRQRVFLSLRCGTLAERWDVSGLVGGRPSLGVGGCMSRLLENRRGAVRAAAECRGCCGGRVSRPPLGSLAR